MSTKRRALPIVATILLLLAVLSGAFAYWYSSQPWIGYETYAAATSGAFGVSAGYALFSVAKVTAVVGGIGGVAAFVASKL